MVSLCLDHAGVDVLALEGDDAPNGEVEGEEEVAHVPPGHPHRSRVR